jgi:D-sedoheptulose 7-phosphate isomerase
VRARINEYFRHLAQVGVDAEASDAQGHTITLEDAVDRVVKLALDVKGRGSQVMFVGNGGSAGIASHMATDWLKNGGFNATAFNDASMLTCLANDLGYDQVFAVPVQRHSRDGDLLFAISSSGKSDSILNAVAAARTKRAKVVTLSGFSPDNPLRKLGDFNFWTPDGHYGFVELSHLALCHAILDITMGWQKAGDLPLAKAPISVPSQ